MKLELKTYPLKNGGEIRVIAIVETNGPSIVFTETTDQNEFHLIQTIKEWYTKEDFERLLSEYGEIELNVEDDKIEFKGLKEENF